MSESEEELPEQAVQKLVTWRQRNGLSQRAAVAAMQERNFPVTLTTLEKWESGERRPGRLAAVALLRFLQDHPTIPRQ
jgi:DNA-binding transcriptional regulator YiaG